MSSDQTRAPYFEALVAYAARNPGRFHIPGHKGGPGADPEMLEAFGAGALAHDIPSLIEGIDVGAEPTPFEQAQELAAEAWGADRSWFLINGASQGNHAGCLAVRQRGKRVVVQRNVHSSVIDGLVLAGLEPEFAAPEIDPELGLAHCLTPDALAEALDRRPTRPRRSSSRPPTSARSPTSPRSPRSRTRATCRSSATRPGARTCASPTASRPARSRAAPT